MANSDIQLNKFANMSDTEYQNTIRTSNIKAFKKVTFNTASTNDYISNEAYKTLRTNLLFCGSDIKTVVLTSCSENEGKSTISIELTKSLAESGKKTLLIDADMRKSTMLRKSVRASDIEGLSEVLSGIAEPEDVIFNTQDDNFDVIFAGRFPPNPVELLGNGRFEQLLCEFRETYDYVIIDSPPLGAVIDSAVIASYCDGAILVIADRKVPHSQAVEVKEQLEKSGCKLLGAVLNETDRKSSKYSKKYYGKQYRYGE